MSNDNLHQVREMTDADRHLIAFVRKLEEGSVDTLEAAARQIITLVTSLMGLFLGILAFGDSPDFLVFSDVKLLGAATLGGLISALFFALDTVLPREHNPQDLAAMRDMLVDILQHKRNALRRAMWAFGVAVLLLLVLMLDILFRA